MEEIKAIDTISKVKMEYDKNLDGVLDDIVEGDYTVSIEIKPLSAIEITTDSNIEIFEDTLNEDGNLLYSVIVTVTKDKDTDNEYIKKVVGSKIFK